MTIHYNKLQADPKQGMSLDIGKLGQSSAVRWPHRPPAPVLSPYDCVSIATGLWSLTFLVKLIPRAWEAQGRSPCSCSKEPVPGFSLPPATSSWTLLL